METKQNDFEDVSYKFFDSLDAVNQMTKEALSNPSTAESQKYSKVDIEKLLAERSKLFGEFLAEKDESAKQKLATAKQKLLEINEKLKS
jgi:hypothetical protein